MVQIGDVVVSLDIFREKFLCDLHACKGKCCIEGDAGAPVEQEEVEKLEEVLPIIWDELSPEARAVIEKQGVGLVVDPMSLQYLVGGSVDYTEGLEGSRFIVTNPNAKSTCGCGSSFSI